MGGRLVVETSLPKEIGFLGALSIGAGAVLGPGEYIVSGEVAAEIGPASVLAFLIAGGLMCLTALSYAELGPMLPLAGGSYHFVKEGWVPRGVSLAGGLVGSDLSPRLLSTLLELLTSFRKLRCFLELLAMLPLELCGSLPRSSGK
ncbi:hypothetical protein AKJ64_02520 [candidate division MSBL1 archaeon SCGC-AAA259E17]|uniref:Amino acid permease/ SLC12A domain-containing protein n=1 Tax=candidate division MSBL1 archaeon SCGC-AAA259E17 TaxID=1698263 RepID=A0A133UER4_9EURY|nr:hypothetical protein AKJ64_02520 [candidate division MSBL1 archaeon SCGC-AAA259E17]